MRFVKGNLTDSFSPVVHSERFGEFYISSHNDGTIVLRGSDYVLEKVWLNPGQRVRSFTQFDDKLLVAYEKGNVRIFSIDTGLLLADFALNFICEKFAVFERVIVCIPHNQTSFSVLHRESLKVVQSPDIGSFAVDAVNLGGTTYIICSSHIYMLKQEHPNIYKFQVELILTAKFLIAKAVAFNGSLMLLSSRELRIMSFSKRTMEIREDFTVPSPDILTQVSSIGIGVLMQCANSQFVFLRDNNIQIVSSPFNEGHRFRENIIITSYALINPFHPELWYTYELENNELCFRKNTVDTKLASELFLLGCKDPSITFIHNKYTGNDRGEINNVPILPSAILLINDEMACSKHGCVKLPLQTVNAVQRDPHGTIFAHGKNELNMLLCDRRLSTQVDITSHVSQNENDWVGIFFRDYVCLQKNNSKRPEIALLHVLSQKTDLELATKRVDPSEVNILKLENLVVYSCENKQTTPRLYTSAAEMLAKIWTQERVMHLLEYSGPHSIRILASMSGFSDIGLSAILNMIEKAIIRPSISDSLSIIWVFLNKSEIVQDIRIPFDCFKLVPESVIVAFSRNITKNYSKKLLDDAAYTLQRPHSPPTQVYYAVKLLQNAVAYSNFPTSKSELVKLVQIIMPTINARVPGAKQILTKLVATNQVQYHQGSQKLLVPTPHNVYQVALVIDLNNEHRQVLKNIKGNSQELQPVFSGDGKMIMAAIGRKRYGWHIVKSFSIFRGDNEIDPVEMK